jgi:hypothetical protein
MATWEEVDASYKEALREEFELGKNLGFIDGALFAYEDLLNGIILGPEPTIKELKELLTLTISNYKALNEELEDVD